MAGSGGSVPGFSGCLSLPVSMTASPPERILPEKASWSAFCSASNLDVFTDEMANSTMNRQKRSVIMSAKDTSQRSLVLVLLLVVSALVTAAPWPDM